MKCQSCGAPLPEAVRICPNCGTLQQAPRRRVQPGVFIASNPTDAKPARLPRLLRALLAVAGLGCAFLSFLIGAGYLGVRVGLNDRATLQAHELDRFFQQGLADMSAGRLELAQADFEYVLQSNPSYPGAAERLQEVRDRINMRLTIVPTPTTSLQEALRDVLRAAREAYSAKDWPNAIARLTQVRRLDPALEPQTVEDMLFDASYTYGRQLLNQDRLEEALYYMEQAAALRPLDRETVDQVEFAKQYLTALGYWNVNWDAAIERFGEMANVVPGYRDVFDRYVRAHILYADAYVASGDYCPAQPLYQQALALRADSQVQAKLEAATAGCLTATPVPITGTIPISGTPVAVPGVSQGRLAYPVFDEATGAYTIYAISPGSAPFAAAVGGQPAWQPNGPRLAYRILGVGINVVDVSNGQTSLFAPAGSSWPAWSPDGSRIAYAQRDASGNFRLIIARLDGAEPAVDLGPGKSPTWGPTGVIAYAGCDASGCGVMVDSPDDTDGPRRLTASASDTPTSWSPDGYNIAYFSDAGGDWDVYFVNLDAGVAQVVNSPGDDAMPAWAPDGAHLAFVSNRDGSWAIYTVRFDGAELTKAIELGAQSPNWINERLAWAP